MLVWDAYVGFLKAHPLISSAVQVGLLGTFGELLGCKLRGRGFMPFTAAQFLLKLLIWAFLGITFKYAFAGFFGFHDALVHKGFWPSLGDSPIWRALSVSTFTNLLFGPVMMLFHRWTDNWIEKGGMNWTTMQAAWKTLLWFWIPAHTVTFSLPAHFQVGLAAVWAIALGVILGVFARKK
jgi:hypothetical protein